METPKYTNVVIYLRKEWRNEDVGQLLNRFPHNWIEFKEQIGVVDEDNIDYIQYEMFVADLIDVFGVEAVLGDEPNGDSIFKVEVTVRQ